MSATHPAGLSGATLMHGPGEDGQAGRAGAADARTREAGRALESAPLLTWLDGVAWGPRGGRCSTCSTSGCGRRWRTRARTSSSSTRYPPAQRSPTLALVALVAVVALAATGPASEYNIFSARPRSNSGDKGQTLVTGSNLVARAARLTASVNVPIPLISGIGAADRIAASDDVCRNAKGHPRSRSEPV